jgi:hypothetical protein
MVTFRFISSGEDRRPLSGRGFAERMSGIQQRARASRDLHAKTTALWQMENISAAFLRNAGPDCTLNDSTLPGEIQAISHCGIGISAAELSEFSPQDVSRRIDSFSHPGYRLFAFENVGAMFGLYEPDPFTFLAQSLARAGILPLIPLKLPDRSSYLVSFPEEVRRLISHGYGRMMYFKETTMAGAVKRIARFPGIDLHAGIMGMAFGCSMVNSGDIHSLWGVAEKISDSAARRSFCEGLVFAIEFWEWMAPGTVDSIVPRSEFEASLLSRALRGVSDGRSRGALRAFSTLAD